MKVLLISAFPPDSAPEANHALHISEHLAASGVSVHVLSKIGSIPGTHPNVVVHPIIGQWTWSALPKLADCMKRCAPDVVFLVYLGWIYDQHPMITFLPTICKWVLPGVPCVTQFEAVDGGAARRSFVARGLRKLLVSRNGAEDRQAFYGTLLQDSARVIALSSPHRDLLAKYALGLHARSSILPPPPLMRCCADEPAVARKRARDAIGASDGDFVLINWGYIYPGKGVETLLQAFRIVRRQKPNIRLVMVGGYLDYPQKPGRPSCRDYYDMVRQLPEELGISAAVTWTGHFSWDSDAGSRYLHAGDACVLPLDWGVTLNNSSLAAAGTHGLPVIGTELPKGRDEMLEHGRNIFLCRPRDPEMLAEAIGLISENADLRERLRSGIIGLARNWHSWGLMTKRLVALLESAAHGAAGLGSSLRPRPSRSLDSSHHLSMPPLACEGQSMDSRKAGLSSRVVLNTDGQDGEDTPLVSIVVAVYNVQNYLSQCLDSLMNQTLVNIEIIVVDDASTDNTSAIIREYTSRYPHLRVITCDTNKGLATVRNLGLNAARGHYVGFLDGDDWADARMCEVMYTRARKDDADVLIADATVFYDDRKKFGRFFDQSIRRALDPQMKQVPFGLNRDRRILLLEPVAWTKLYKRSFLQRHAIHFEDGMNSYEDICFHFSVLLKATRISLIDDALIFYRQNRPGQISGRTDQRIFEVFAVFDRIYQNLNAWDVSYDIWTMLVKVQLRQFAWLLTDRVQFHQRREFFAKVAEQLRKVPKDAFHGFARGATCADWTTLLCMRQSWLRAYDVISSRRGPLFALLYIALHMGRTHRLKEACGECLTILRQRLGLAVRSVAKNAINLEDFQKKIQTIYVGLNELRVKDPASLGKDPLYEVHHIGDQTLFLSSHPYKLSLGEAVWRVETDYFLAQMAVFREDDMIVDVGAYLGVFSIYLAKKYPFVRVYAVEPDPVSYDCLLRNIELNGASNVTAVNKAISGTRQERTLYVDAWNCAWSTVDAATASTRSVLRTAPVDTLTLEQLFQSQKIDHCRLLKITAPGAVRESLEKFRTPACIDLLCGEADLEDCSRVRLEAASWRLARQYFWRTVDRRSKPAVQSWIHQAPTGIERTAKAHSPVCAIDLEGRAPFPASTHSTKASRAGTACHNGRVGIQS